MRCATRASNGPNRLGVCALQGNYDGPLCAAGGASCFPSLGQAVATMNAGGKTTVVTDIKDIQSAVAAAKAADFVILAVDNFKDGGGEGHDRYTIALSSEQLTLANAVLAVNKNAVLAAAGETVIFAEIPSPSRLKHLLNGEGGRSRMTELSPTCAAMQLGRRQPIVHAANIDYAPKRWA